MMKIIILLLCLGHCCHVMAAEDASACHDLAKKVEKLEFLLAKTIQESEDQKKHLSSQVEESEKQKKIIEDLQAQLGNVQHVDKHFQSQLDKQADAIDKLQSENERNQNSYVSFTATASETRDYDAGDHVLFDSIIRNYGESYFVDNSTFICSHSAYYLFSISVRSLSVSGMHGAIMLDNSELVQTWATTAASNQWASNQMVTYCAAGQSVWVMCGYGVGNKMFGGIPYSTFSGTLLRLA